MNRLRFRVWDKEEKKFVDYPVYFNLTNSEVVTELWYGYEIHIEEPLQDSNYIVQQSTGLKDKNGKEIFEGDVLEILVAIDTETLNGEVVFEDGIFGVKNVLYGWGFEFGLVPLIEIILAKKVIIVGNKFESKELLNDRNLGRY